MAVLMPKTAVKHCSFNSIRPKRITGYDQRRCSRAWERNHLVILNDSASGSPKLLNLNPTQIDLSTQNLLMRFWGLGKFEAENNRVNKIQLWRRTWSWILRTQNTASMVAQNTIYWNSRVFSPMSLGGHFFFFFKCEFGFFWWLLVGFTLSYSTKALASQNNVDEKEKKRKEPKKKIVSVQNANSLFFIPFRGQKFFSFPFIPLTYN